MNITLFLISLICILTFSPVFCEDDTYSPGVRVFIMKDALNFFDSVMLGSITEFINDITFTDLHYEAPAGLSFDMSNVVVSNFSYAPTNYFRPSYYIEERWADMYCSIDFDFDFHDAINIVDVNASATMYFQEGSAALTFHMDEDPDDSGHLKIYIYEFDLDFGKDDIEIYNTDESIVQTIVDIFYPMFKGTIESWVKDAISDFVNDGIEEFLALIPLSHTVDAWSSFEWGLIPERSLHQFEGTYYHNAIFGSDEDDLAMTGEDLSDGHHIKNYKSLRVTGYFSPLEEGDYKFHGDYDSILRVTLNGTGYGHDLEHHNPGMCWPEHHTFTTDAYHLTPSDFLEVMVEYQVGCGGGSFKVTLIKDDEDGVTIPTLQIFDTTGIGEDQEPVIVTDDPEPGFASFASLAMFVPVYGALPAITKSELPVEPLTTVLEGEHFHCAIDESVMDTYIQSHVEAGIMESLIFTDDDIPAIETEYRMTVGGIGDLFFTNLDDFYSPSRYIMLTFDGDVNGSGSKIIASEGMSFNMAVIAYFDVCASGTKSTPSENIATVDMSFEGVMFFEVLQGDEAVIYARVDSLDIGSDPVVTSVKDGLEVDQDSFDDFEYFFNLLSVESFIPFLNNLLIQNGFEIPAPGNTYIDSVNLQYMDGYAYLVWRLALEE
eukprot:gnl/Carplike_NY0171/2981_a4010_545.p1 GENE.gnl/Carplike_NY0171/2981_a4010_545~~gnl/Carplike_NY0171/2981_a4010_545.p1  ORF type:complete len:659 (+),score=177.88 gnl/Carplike_NY0171/2981_a4010_545:12-1988(+)